MPRRMQRCPWCGTDPIYVEYHDEEWGVPNHDEQHLFEMLVLEGAQAGLSWSTILHKRPAYRKAFASFDPEKVARFDAKKKAKLMADASIVRNRLKIEAAIINAKKFLDLQEEIGSFDRYLWNFVDGTPIQNKRRTLKDVPPTTSHSDALSKDLKRRGFKFVGSTICYSLMQAVGLVNDHLVTCFRHAEVDPSRRRRRTVE
jgi:DNA-3-methyladenine glycosylase I